VEELRVHPVHLCTSKDLVKKNECKNFKHMAIHDNLLVYGKPNNDMLINECYNLKM
jgi:hypothetical protein